MSHPRARGTPTEMLVAKPPERGLAEPDDADPFADWTDDEMSGGDIAGSVASAMTGPAGTGAAIAEGTHEVEVATRSRTATLHDPLTSAVLAEVARRGEAGDEPRPTMRNVVRRAKTQ